MARPVVEFVVTEPPPAMAPAVERHYEVIRGRIQRTAGVPVLSRSYAEVGDFDDVAAVVLSGSFTPWAEHHPGALARLGDCMKQFDGPVLGICAGMQLQIMFAGGEIAPRVRPALGYGRIDVLDDTGLLEGLGSSASVYEHHSCDVIELPAEFVVLARSADCAVEAVAASERPWWGTQFHPEEFSPRYPAGEKVLRNFFALAGLGA